MISERDRLDLLSRRIIGAAIEVHKILGPGLLESAYKACLAFELHERGFRLETERLLPVVYKGVMLDCGYRMDVVVEDAVVIEVKAVADLAPFTKHSCYPISAFLD
jgi:GxxExxY protein